MQVGFELDYLFVLLSTEADWKTHLGKKLRKNHQSRYNNYLQKHIWENAKITMSVQRCEKELLLESRRAVIPEVPVSEGGQTADLW